LVLHEIVHEMQVKKFCGIILKLDFEKAYERVHWEFLKEVMVLKGFEKAYERVHWEFLKEVMVLKGFPKKWRDWIMQSVEGGKISININNE
jgi:hypothetical protein